MAIALRSHIGGRSAAPEFTGARWYRGQAGLVVLVVAGASSLGALAGADVEAFLGAVIIGSVAALCLRGPLFRLAVSVVGALIVFQSDFTALKYAYLALVTLCFTMSVGSVLDDRGRLKREFFGLVLTALALASYLLCTFFVAAANGTTFDSWFRDVLSYLLVVMLPFIGIAAGARMSVRWSRTAFMVIGLVCSIGLAIDWLERRGVSALPIDQFLLPSTVMIALSFAYAITLAAVPGSGIALRICCTLTAGVIALSMVISGSRSATLVLLAAFAGVVGVSRRMQVSPTRALALVATVTSVLFVAVPPLAALVISEPGFLQARIDAALTAMHGGLGQDQSFAARDLSYEWTARSFGEHPIVGTGPGYLYQLPDIPSIKTFTLDASGIVPAKFGVVGVMILVAFLLCVVHSVRTIRGGAPLPFYTAARGWLVVLVLLVPFGPWLEDKGFALALAMLFAGIAAENHARALSEPV